MVRLRKLASEFYSERDLGTNAQLTMPYLEDMQAFQEFQDGDLTKLWSRNLGNAVKQNVSGARFYVKAGNGAYWKLNMFQVVTHAYLAAVFERSPHPLDDNEEVQNQWLIDGPAIIREARRAVEWFISKGRAILQVMNYADITGDTPTIGRVPRALDPQFWVPIVNRIDRDLHIGSGTVRPFYSQARLPNGNNYADKVEIGLYVTKEQAALSEGDTTEQNTRSIYTWNGIAQGTVGSPTVYKIGDQEKSEPNARLEGMWTFGNDYSIYGAMESNAYETLLLMTHARTALTRDVRSVRIDPKAQDIDPETGRRREFDPLDPRFEISLNAPEGAGSALGYVEPPGPAMAEAFMALANVSLDNMAYVCNTPRETFGNNYMANEPAEAFRIINHIFTTIIIDIRDELAKIMPMMWEAMGGPSGVKIGWDLEPFASTVAHKNEIRADFASGIIPLPFTQIQLGYPVMEVRQADNGQEDGQTDNQDGQTEDETEIEESEE